MLWIHVDGSSRIGFGHVMRCVALAEEGRARGMEVTFVTVTPEAAAALRPRGWQTRHLQPSQRMPSLEAVASSDLVVFDGYHFSSAQHEAASSRGARVAVIDDLATGSFDVDVVVNQNPIEHPGYDLPSGTRLLLGHDYALIRREFHPFRRLRAGPTGRLLLTFGGSDVAGLAPQALRVLSERRSFDGALLVVGPGAPVPADGAPWLEVVHAPSEVGSVFDRADAALAAAGSTTWELLYMGIPTALIQVADNQQHVAEPTARIGAAIHLGRAPLRDDVMTEGIARLARDDVRESLSRMALATVDGHGPARVLDALEAR